MLEKAGMLDIVRIPPRWDIVAFIEDGHGNMFIKSGIYALTKNTRSYRSELSRPNLYAKSFDSI
jgi:hypothetical protein